MYNSPLNRPMFQKKVPRYHNGGGIAYLAHGGTSETGVPGERTRIDPRTRKPPVPDIRRNLNLIDKNIGSGKGQGPRTINKPPPNWLGRGKGILSNIYRKTKPFRGNLASLGSKALSNKGNIGIAALLGIPLGISENPEWNPTRKGFQVLPKGLGPLNTSPLLGRGDDEETLKRYVEGADGFEPDIYAGGLRRGLADMLPRENPLLLQLLKGTYQNPNILRGGLNSREAFEETIDNAKDQLGLGMSGRLASIFRTTKAGEITTSKKIANWLETNKEILYQMSTKDQESAKTFIETLQDPEGLKDLILAQDPETYYEIFTDEEREEKGVDTKKLWDEAAKGISGAYKDEKAAKDKLELEKALSNQKARQEVLRRQAIEGRETSPEVIDKALTAGMYGGRPEDTAFAFLEDAEITRLVEEDKEQLRKIEMAKILGTGYADAKESELGQTGIKINFFQPTTPGGQERLTDTAWHDAKNQIVDKLDNYALANSRLIQLENILADGNPSSLKAYLIKIGAKLGAAFGKDFEKQTAADKYQALQNIVQAEFTAQFLNESGRTISDRDRQLVRDIFADVGKLYTIGTPLETLKHKLNEVRAIVMNGSEEFKTAFTRINMANPKMAMTFNNKELTDEEKIELDSYEKRGDLTEEEIQSFQESIDEYN